MASTAVTGRFEGPLVKFGSPERHDTDKEFFTKNTDFGFGGRATIESAVYWHHSHDARVGVTVIGRGKLTMRADCVWISGQLDMTLACAKAIAELIDEGEGGEAAVVGMSSGSAAHLVRYGPTRKGAREITRWPLGLDASLTPSPADCDTFCVAAKGELEIELERRAAEDREWKRQDRIATERLLASNRMKAYLIGAQSVKAAALDGFDAEAWKLQQLHARRAYLARVEKMRRAGRLGTGAMKARTVEEALKSLKERSAAGRHRARVDELIAGMETERRARWQGLRAQLDALKTRNDDARASW